MAPPQKSIDLPKLQRATLQQARTQSLVPMKFDAGMDPNMGIFDRIGEKAGQDLATAAANPAGDLKAPRITLCPTLPYTREEMIKILATTDKYLNEMPKHGKENGRRTRALVLLLRYSGMRISDAANLRACQIKGNRLFLYTQKTGCQ